MLRTNPAFLHFMERFTASGGESEAVAIKTFTAGTRLIRQGDTISHVYIIREGITKCYIEEDNGKDYIFEFLGKGEITGDLEGIRKEKCLCNIEAITPVTVYAIPHTLFSWLLLNNTAFNGLMLEELVIRIRQTCIRASYQQLYPVEYALLRLLALEAEQDIVIPKKDMAAYLGITTRSFNRTLKELRAKNILDPQGMNIDLTRKQLEEILRRFEDMK
ncbi:MULTISPECIES: Crp/Fnr family transcriptional regulator [Chitinophaga]|uniref:Crp/Fnr family transcriptional regulator n=1 Tax=Chitinophaga TaxID=79328 RepID=UPI000DBA201D|nr:Crp/Fnr family transcriptional regulator [Chitinophaga ginsengisegetis]MDR6570027.1 CRP-like cAMP-binding protein [Chitinophaga ginsengisegetis]MDR6649760.1 CRP-like cAMP-binding protein [Chitinophaga ginsengisegetis]MDR6656037.1 CRP-like cAMP-binding protein [Chitinophaga ginsengisegetis]